MTKRSITGLMLLALLSGCGGESAQDMVGAVTGMALGPLAGDGSTSAVAAAATSGCLSRSSRYPWGQFPLQTWTPRTPAETLSAGLPGEAHGPAFSARLVQAYGSDYGEERRTVILEMADGCRRQFVASSFVDADNQVIAAEIARRPSVPDPASYRVAYNGVTTTPELVASGQLNLRQTQHFAIWYGNGADDSYEFYRTATARGQTVAQVVEDTAEWLERVWYLTRDVFGAPMPFANDTDKVKLNIFLCGTGRPNSEGDKDGCGAGAAVEMGISAWALATGSLVVSHEFGHMLQNYSGGIRGPNAGPIWETHAEWTGHVIDPRYNGATHYFNNLELGPLFSSTRYSSYPFIHYLWETDRTRSLVWGTWTASAAGTAPGEDFLPTMIAAGRQSGAFPDGYRTFADDMGWYGARLVTMDFHNQRNFMDNIRTSDGKRLAATFYTPLVRGAQAGSYTSSTLRGLRQWGTHLVPLTATGSKVTVTLTGRNTSVNAAWRFALVAATNDLTPIYSPLGKVESGGSSTVSLTVPQGAKVYLAVTATPYRYESLGWQDLGKAPAGTVYPYAVKLTGATAYDGPATACNPTAPADAGTDNYILNGNAEGWRPCA